MIAQGNPHLIHPGIVAAEVFPNLLVLFRAVGFPALHLDDEFIDRLFQGGHTHIKLVQKKTDNRDGYDLDDVKDILEDKIKWFHARKNELSDLFMNSLRCIAFALPPYRLEWKYAG